jgi:hypothetical protein
MSGSECKPDRAQQVIKMSGCECKPDRAQQVIEMSGCECKPDRAQQVIKMSGCGKSRIFRLFPILTFAVSLSLFAQGQPQQPKPVSPAQPPEELPSVLSVPKDYHYTARGRRDPFVNPIPKPAQKTAAPAVAPVTRPPGLKGVLVSEADIAGIVVSKESSMNVITISAPGGRRYFARVGDALLDGRVKTIRPDSVTFDMTDPGNEPKGPREIVRKLRPLPGENK